ncbi:MAG: hypothetical protein Pg6B_00010 [Candidatus Azobacteroides pseudotrichonymphae]|nr:MAG: hypothetical protein Pg6B_00010 [Candidatus Azobacteroides pseudotrichonymphae]
MPDHHQVIVEEVVVCCYRQYLYTKLASAIQVTANALSQGFRCVSAALFSHFASSMSFGFCWFSDYV